MAAGHLREIFLSIQGEGSHIGRPQVFMRLAGCPLRCRYCDTPAALVTSPTFRVLTPEGRWSEGANPVAAHELPALLDEADPGGLARELAITGGEPLHQPDLLADFLPLVRPERRVYLETAGVHTEALERLIDLVDVVAMDIKLPSVAGEGVRWREHAAFLAVACRREVVVKVVVAPGGSQQEVERAARLVAAVDPSLPFVLQPETARGNSSGATGGEESGRWLLHLTALASGILRDVRVIPQAHKLLGLP